MGFHHALISILLLILAPVAAYAYIVMLNAKIDATTMPAVTAIPTNARGILPLVSL